jgi:hypothetical protein
MQYQIYSLEKPPRLLRTITGGDYFSAADTDLDGQVEIWTHDASGVDGFEGLSLAEMDSPPAVILRFSHGELLDVSREFQPYFDREIAKLRDGLNPDDLRDFRSSDGRLLPGAPLSAGRIHSLRKTKVQVLEIIWSYLYSGRDPEAWRVLAELWPPGDIERIRAALLNARAHGISLQTRGASPPGMAKRRKHVTVFDAVNHSPGGSLAIIPPQSIMLFRPPETPSPDRKLSPSESFLSLVIDSAGKVRKVEPAGKFPVDETLIGATAGWKFIPAFSADRAVASRMRLSVSLQQ